MSYARSMPGRAAGELPLFQSRRRPDRARCEAAATVWAHVLEHMLDAVEPNKRSAFEGADDSHRRMPGKVRGAALADRSQLEGHDDIVARHRSAQRRRPHDSGHGWSMGRGLHEPSRARCRAAAEQKIAPDEDRIRIDIAVGGTSRAHTILENRRHVEDRATHPHATTSTRSCCGAHTEQSTAPRGSSIAPERTPAPPSMTYVSPVIHDARSEARNVARLAMSCLAESLRRQGSREAVAVVRDQHRRSRSSQPARCGT